MLLDISEGVIQYGHFLIKLIIILAIIFLILLFVQWLGKHFGKIPPQNEDTPPTDSNCADQNFSKIDQTEKNTK